MTVSAKSRFKYCKPFTLMGIPNKATNIFARALITCHRKDKEGNSQIVKPDIKKINMVMYLFPYKIKEKVMSQSIKMMRDEKVDAAELGKYIQANTGVGIEFKHYFGLK